MFKKLFVPFAVILILVLGVVNVQAAETDFDNDADTELEVGYPWRSHKGPLNFTFNNMIDSHQQSQDDNKGRLHGFIYIHFTGEHTEDGIPIARKANCEVEECSVGWVIKGFSYQATLVNKGPRIWLMDSAGLPKEPGYTHFHWYGMPQKPNGLTLNNSYNGYLLKRVAVTTFYWLGGSGSGGGCSGDDGGNCSDGGDTGSCGEDEGGDMGDSNSGHGGRLVIEGLDPHSNIVTEWNGTWHGDCGDD